MILHFTHPNITPEEETLLEGLNIFTDTYNGAYYESEIQSFFSEYSRKTERIEELENHISTLEHSINGSQGRIEELESEIARMKEAEEKMDKELDIVHDCLTELYNDENGRIYKRIQQCLDQIEALGVPHQINKPEQHE